MATLPRPVAEYLSDLTISHRSPACLLIGRDGRLLDWQGVLDYGIFGLEKGARATERVYFLEGLLPLDDDPVVLPCVSTSSGWPAEIHLFPGEAGDWVVLLDAKTEERRRWQLKQKADELALLQERQAGLIEDLDAFAHTVAHDLKGPLTNIIGFAELLTAVGVAPTEEKKQRYLKEVAESGRHMDRIIEELLLMAGVRKQEVTVKPFDMAPVVTAAAGRLTYMIEQSHAELVVLDSWPAALGYAPWVEEVWTNYLSNAVKYGGDPPRVELGAQEREDGMIRFWVRDNGPGIPPDTRARLFVPHTRLETTRAGGHGLGLSIVRRIVQKLGGEVSVESEEGHGSTFGFTLRSATD